MSEMSMNRAIHGAVRRDLTRFVDALSSFPIGNHGRAQAIHRAWENFEDQLTHHHEGEHEIAWPALRSIGVSEALLSELDEEHDAMAKAMAHTRVAIDAFSTTANKDDTAASLAALTTLQGVIQHHLDHEESTIEPVFLEKKDDPAIVAMGKAFGKVSPARGGRFFAWVMDGADDDELAAIIRDVPGPVLTIIGGIFGRGYRKNIAPTWQGQH